MQVTFSRTGVALMLAASLAAGGARAAEQLERDDAQAAAKEPKKQLDSKEPKKDLDARLEQAQKRLQQAASEVAALSAVIAAQVMDSIATSFSEGPRRTVIGVQLEPSGGGARVQDVSPGGPAEQAGIRAGDVIVAVNGKEVKGTTAAREVVGLLREVAPDGKVKVRVLRDGKPKDFDVVARPFDPRTFAYRTDPPPGFNFNPPEVNIDPEPFSQFGNQFGPFNYSNGFRREIDGMELTTLTPQLAHYFGTDKGVLVVRAPQNDLFRLQDGDVILNIDGRVPTNGSHITRILRSYQPGEKVVIRVMRDRKPTDLEVTLPEDASRHRRTRATRLDVESLPL